MSDRGVGLWDAAHCGWACMDPVCQTKVLDHGMLPTVNGPVLVQYPLWMGLHGSDMSDQGVGLWDAAHCGWACMGQICQAMVLDCGMLPTVDGPAWVRYVRP